MTYPPYLSRARTLMSGAVASGAALALAVACGPGCLLQFPSRFEFEYSIGQTYFCSGDEIDVEWETSEVKKIELKRNSDGPTIFETTSASGTAAVTITGDMQPLRIRVTDSDDEVHWFEVPRDELINIDDPTWTEEIPNTDEVLLEPDGMRLNAMSTDEVGGDTVTEYEIYASYRGYIWHRTNAITWPEGTEPEGTLPGFTASARVSALENLTSERLVFSGSGFSDVRLSAGENGDVPVNPPANMTQVRGLYPGNQTRDVFWGRQWGEYMKDPPDPNFRREQTYVPTPVRMRLQVFCETSPTL